MTGESERTELSQERTARPDVTDAIEGSNGDAPAPSVEADGLDAELEKAREAALRSEQELGRALTRLEQSIREPLDIRGHIGDAPIRWLAGAFVIGFLIGRAARGPDRFDG